MCYRVTILFLNTNQQIRHQSSYKVSACWGLHNGHLQGFLRGLLAGEVGVMYGLTYSLYHPGGNELPMEMILGGYLSSRLSMICAHEA